MKKNYMFSIGVAISMMAASASATTLSIDSSLGNNVYLNGATSGSFDIASQLNPASNYVAPYQISSASVLFSFVDNANDLVKVSEVYGNYYPATVTARTHLTTYTDAAEAATLNIGTQSTSGQTTYYSNPSHVVSSTVDWSYYGNNCPGYTGPCNHTLFQGTTVNSEATSGYTGAFDLASILNGDNLASLANTGKLSFNLGITGDLILKSATLTLNISENPGQSVSEVPEPSEFALMLSGLGLLGFAFHRKQAVRA